MMLTARAHAPVLAIVALATVLALACSSGEKPSPTPARATPPAAVTAAPAATAAPSPTPTPVPSDAAPRVMALLISELGVPASEVKLVQVTHVDWPDTSLGCPEPGKFYAEVITPGWRVVVDHRGQTYEFHTDESGERIVNCAAVKASTGETVNVAGAAGLREVWEVTILRRDFATGAFNEIGRVTDAAEAREFAAALDLDLELSPRKDCAAVFKVIYRASSGAHEFEFVCADDFRMVRGLQGFWKGMQAQAPVEFGSLVGKYASQVPFPGMPGQ